MLWFRTALIWGCLGLLFPLSQMAFAGTISLAGVADGSSAYYEHFSDGFIQVDLYDPPPRETQQRFHSISNPATEYGSLTYDGYPNDANFHLGSITYDETALVGGTGSAPITAVSLGIGADPADPTYININRWSPTTTVNAFSGTVSFLSGVPTGIYLNATATLDFTAFAVPVSAPGTFTVNGSYFDGDFDSGDVLGAGTSFVWDVHGNISAVPEPSSLAILGGAVVCLLVFAGCRARAGKHAAVRPVGFRGPRFFGSQFSFRFRNP
ncbi:MAG TPA: hypothetical protein VFE24_17710 [Pirellulales bacterium]|nr:hypothetical protein [Pirellulales bacterium]